MSEEPVVAPPAEESRPVKTISGAKALAAVWFVVSVIGALVMMLGTRFATYGGDAYTGIQNAVSRGTIALGFVIIGTGVLAITTAFHREQ